MDRGVVHPTRRYATAPLIGASFCHRAFGQTLPNSKSGCRGRCRSRFQLFATCLAPLPKHSDSQFIKSTSRRLQVVNVWLPPSAESVGTFAGYLASEATVPMMSHANMYYHEFELFVSITGALVFPIGKLSMRV